MQIYASFKAELRYVLTSRKTFLLLFGIPLFYTLLFGYMYRANAIKHIPTVILDENQSAMSRSFSDLFVDSERLQVVAIVDAEEEMQRYLASEQALVAIGIPADFAKKIKSGHGSKALFMVNANNLVYANSALTCMREIIGVYNAQLGKKLLQGVKQLPQESLRGAAPLSFRVRLLNNPTNAYTYFMLPGMTMNSIQISIILCTCVALLREYQNPQASAAEIFWGKLLCYWLGGTMMAIVAVFLNIALFGLPLRGSVFSIFFLCAAFTFVITNIGLLFSTLGQGVLGPLNPLHLIYIMSSLLCSGFSWPRLATDLFFHIYCFFLPIAHVAESLRDLLLAGHAPHLINHIVVLFFSGTMLSLLTIYRFRGRREKLLLAQGKGIGG